LKEKLKMLYNYFVLSKAVALWESFMSFRKKEFLKIGAIFILLFSYFIGFLFAYNEIGIIGIIFSMIPIIVAASIYGRIGGITTALITFLVNLGLIYIMVGEIDTTNPGIILGSIFLFLIGIFVGWTTDKDREMQNELHERRIAEDRLAETESWYRNIFDGVNDAILVESITGEVLDVNTQACEIFGWTHDQFLTKTTKDMVPPEYQALLPKGEEESFSNTSFETVNMRANGEYFPVLVSGRAQIIGEEKRLVIVVRDITERILNEKEIKRHHQFLSHIIEALTQPFYVVNIEDYSVAVANAAARGSNALESATTCYALTHGRNTPCEGKEHPCPIKAVVERREVVRTEHIHYSENGKKKYFEYYGYPIFDSRGNISQMIEYSVDITDRKNAMVALENAKNVAEAATKTKADFLANMSHEIRTPLNAIYGMTNLMLDTTLDEEQEDFIKTIQGGSDTLLRVINDILDFSKIEAGKMELEKHPFKVHACIAGTLTLLAEKATNKKLKISSSIEDGTPPVLLGDITRLRQILVNLLNNAIKFTEKGEIKIKIQARMLKNNLYELLFSIRDTGIGIPEDKIGQLFESFSQVDTSTTRKYGGSGLGLAISRELAEKMGGKMWVESEEGIGSTFFFTILAEEARELKPEPSIKIDLSLGKKHPLRILLVEDNLINQKVASKLLERLSYKVDVAANGVKALEALEKQIYDVVFMDIQMPEMDGDEATKYIRENFSEERQPYIIAMTAHALKGDREKYLANGMNDYVSKPISVENIIKALKKAQPIS
jgi:PAS domain S-box-containing protein